jgi:hypothetical protein
MAKEQSSQHENDEGLTGTPNSSYDVVSILYHSLKAAEMAACFKEDAEDEDKGELAEFFDNMNVRFRDIAEEAKSMLRQELEDNEEEVEDRKQKGRSNNKRSSNVRSFKGEKSKR